MLLFPKVLSFDLKVTKKITAYFAFLFLFSRPFVGACLLRAGKGARVRRFEAWLLLPDTSLLHE